MSEEIREEKTIPNIPKPPILLINLLPIKKKMKTLNLTEVSKLKDSVFSNLQSEITLDLKEIDKFFTYKKEKTLNRKRSQEIVFPVEHLKMIKVYSALRKLKLIFHMDQKRLIELIEAVYIKEKGEESFLENLLNQEFLSYICGTLPNAEEVKSLEIMKSLPEHLNESEEFIVNVSKLNHNLNEFFTSLLTLINIRSQVESQVKQLKLFETTFNIIQEDMNLRKLLKIILEVNNYINNQMSRKKYSSFDVNILNSILELKPVSTDTVFKSFYDLILKNYLSNSSNSLKDCLFFEKDNQMNLLSDCVSFSYQEFKKDITSGIGKVENSSKCEEECQNYFLKEKIKEIEADIFEKYSLIYKSNLTLKEQSFLTFFGYVHKSENEDTRMIEELIRTIVCVCSKMNESIRNEFSHNLSNKENSSLYSNKKSKEGGKSVNDVSHDVTQKNSKNIEILTKETKKTVTKVSYIKPNSCLINRYNI